MGAKCDLEAMLTRLKSEKEFILVPIKQGGKGGFETVLLANLPLAKFGEIVSRGLLSQDYFQEGIGGGDGGQIGNGSHRSTSKKSRPGRIWKNNKS